jgi:hypothetical protein
MFSVVAYVVNIQVLSMRICVSVGGLCSVLLCVVLRVLFSITMIVIMKTLPMFRRNILPPSSWSKRKSRKQHIASIFFNNFH